GAGGTQRLPRAVGLERGLTMMLSGESVSAGSIGEGPLIARMLGADPLAEAVSFAMEVRGAPAPRLRDAVLGDDQTEALLAFTDRSVIGSAPREAIVAAVRAGMADIDRGFFEEQRL